ncbi:hypothetical protein SPI_06238 [Niveomyces insectorum RCEF 264]|uniref:Uncharacterized protein n=1 Tax=Niveomyces insectorum RCEF 264 TaxID=1081102 RepID=A0A167RXJ1_9HYPO|nr:hypothetical protein SPI_06238 [Niveomyces insectorum RCEF 264]
MADLSWSLDSTRLVFWQTLATVPDCGSATPPPSFRPRNLTVATAMFVATVSTRALTSPAVALGHMLLATPALGALLVLPRLHTPCTARRRATQREHHLGHNDNRDRVGGVQELFRRRAKLPERLGEGDRVGRGSVHLLVRRVLGYYTVQYREVMKKTGSSGYQTCTNVNTHILESKEILVTTIDGVEWPSPLSGTRGAGKIGEKTGPSFSQLFHIQTTIIMVLPSLREVS